MLSFNEVEGGPLVSRGRLLVAGMDGPGGQAIQA